ncbi:hypothetical protein K0M31_018671 [Melipona bicolor]|uniref:Uncharacterized protein n=1 Tax=Melipona bicolor TaxID=60889 RepID=A0AA40G4T9_9HYME|nr:hypothetical protein K0M31_018671 [Melipona bicolor]
MNRLTLKKLDSPDECLPETSTGKSCTDQSIYKLVQTDSSNSSDSLISDDEETMPEVEEHEDIDPCDMNTKLKTTEPYGKMKRSLSNYRYKNNSDSFGEFQSTESRYTHERKKQKNDAETIETEIKQEPNRKVEETEIKQEPSRKVEETEIKQEPSRKVEETEIKQEPNRKVEETEIKQEPNRKVEETVAQVAIQHEEMIAGIKVKFPVKPDSSQIDIAHKVIQCCMKEENCLLESPSESGRILALLCSVLAWHDHHVGEFKKLIKQLQITTLSRI